MRFGQQKRYQDWFQRQYLSTPDSQSLRCDLIRYICGVVHPSNEVLSSDILPRWAIIGWLLTTCTVRVGAVGGGCWVSPSRCPDLRAASRRSKSPALRALFTPCLLRVAAFAPPPFLSRIISCTRFFPSGFGVEWVHLRLYCQSPSLGSQAALLPETTWAQVQACAPPTSLPCPWPSFGYVPSPVVVNQQWSCFSSWCPGGPLCSLASSCPVTSLALPSDWVPGMC